METDARTGTDTALLTLRRTVPWAIAAGLAVVTAWVAQLYQAARTETALSRAQQELTEVALQAARNRLEVERVIYSRRLGAMNRAAGENHGEIGRESQDRRPTDLKIATLAAKADEAKRPRAVAIWDPLAQAGVLEVEHLPATGVDENYQLWLTDPQYPDPVDGGAFAIEPRTATTRVEFKPKQPVRDIELFAITREAQGGAPKPTSPPVLLGR